MGLFSRRSNNTSNVSPVSSASATNGGGANNVTENSNASVVSGSNASSSASSNVKDKLIPIDTVFLKPPQSYYDNLPNLIKKHDELLDLDETQQKTYDKLLDMLNAEDFKLPIKNCTKWEEEPEEEWIPLTSWEKFYLTKECLLRFLVGCKWKYEDTIKQLLETLVWRREFGLTYDEENFDYNIQPEDIELENETGKQVVLGYDKTGYALLYMKDGLQNTNSSLEKVQHMIFMIESTILLNPKGCTNAVIVVDFKHYPDVPGVLKKRKMAPLSIAKQCLHICQTYYPETLGYALFVNVPWIAWTFFKMMIPFVDPNTKKRFVFDEPVENYVDPDNLDAAYGGNLDFHYNHKVYWPDFIQKLKERRLGNYNRFLELGGTIGLSEFDIKP